MGTTTRYQFREYTVSTVLDAMALPTVEAVCVTGEEQDCGAASGQMHTPEELTRWIAAHCAQTGHAINERTARATLRAEPGEWK